MKKTKQNKNSDAHTPAHTRYAVTQKAQHGRSLVWAFQHLTERHTAHKSGIVKHPQVYTRIHYCLPKASLHSQAVFGHALAARGLSFLFCF